MSSSALQLYGCTKRVLIEKRRNSKATCCECCSHLIIIGILVIGYGLSVVENFSARKYSDIVLHIPLANDTSSALDLYNNITSGPLIVPTFDQYIALNEFLSDNVDQLGDYGSLLSSTALGRTYTNLLYKGGLHFAPNGPEVDSLIAFMNRTYTRFASVDIYVHDSEEAGIGYILDHLGDPALALIVLRQITPAKVNYLIRQNYTTLPNTNQVVDDGAIGLNTDYQSYFFSGFLSLERAVNAWAFEYTNSVTGPDNPDAPAECTGPPEMVVTPFPTPQYNQNPFYQQVGFLLGLAIVMSTMYPMSRLTKAVVEEKELRMREVMKIMGLRDWVHQLSWFLPAFVLFLWIAISCAAITLASFLKHSDGGLVFIFFFLFAMSEINFAFLVSVFFSNSKLAAIVAPVILFAALMPRYSFLNTNSNEMVPGKYLCCLLSPSAFAFGADMIAAYEYTGVGIQASNAGRGGFSFYGVLLMLWADFFIYGFLAWYLDQVLPHEHGSTHHPLFFLSFRYWCPRSRPSNFSGQQLTEELTDMPEFNDNNDAGQSSIETIPPEMRALAHVRIKNLRKRYPDGNLAVRDFSLSMLEGQITCLLGHNGAGAYKWSNSRWGAYFHYRCYVRVRAGKTTTISALTGLTEATSGEVSIYGCSLRYDLPAIRQMTGIW
jgi:ATP-binding cassette subfamily A (ABC1) protein 3